MLNSGKKFRALRNKKINILTLVLSKKKFLNETNNHNPSPPFKLNGRSLIDHQRKDFFILLNRLNKKLKLKISCSTTQSYQVFQSI